MRLQRRKRCFAAAVTAAILLLSGCGGSFSGAESKTEDVNPNLEKEVRSVKLDPDDPVDITLWHYYNGVQQQEMKELAEVFNSTVGADEGIFVHVISQGSTDNLMEQLSDSMAGKVGAKERPDMFSAYADNAYDWDCQGKLVDLSVYFSEDELSEYIEEYVKSGYFNGGLKLFPVAKSTEVFALNKTDWDVFAKETGAKTDDLATWEGIAKTAGKYYDWSGGKAFFGRDAVANYIFTGSAQLGKKICTVDEKGQVVYQMDKKVFRKLWDNYYVPYIHGYYTSEGKFRSDDAKTGTILGCVASSSSVGYFPNEVSDEDGNTRPIEAEIYPAPNFEGSSNMAVSQGAGIAVFKGEEKREYACVRFLKWFTDVEQNVDFSHNSGYLPVKKEAQQPEQFTINNENDIMAKALKTTLAMAKDYEYYETPVFDGAYDMRSKIGYAMEDKAKEDRKEIHRLEVEGLPHEEAVARFDTDENFEAWFAKLCENINN